ncbi:hypothetical protein A3B87_00295 [Candidatus Kuenenbacteria bacterium RIFCSPHIGHO2_02_FULL_39_13]|uniref:Uncharacterized protein n=1 Tax=Candidatus Kuenenbacteria bacterium RIFCSPHIGHO2_02_FULL_39_13 TaxID=1798561 RepID=A0A1F6FMM2_9BACT|nr:MAG: hypothetical protein A3B87_00295 [Candidatus Kuenenbacteria bacterium RIFCSPHIGHO2_02_FULL_39_13]
MDNKKKIIIIFILVIILIVAAVFIVKEISKGDQAVIPNEAGNEASAGGGSEVALPGSEAGEQQQPAPSGNEAATVTEEEIDKKQAENRAKFFTAMLGSYSAAANFANVLDLRPLMSDKMLSWSEDFIARNINTPPEESMVTYALKTKVLSYSPLRTSLIVSTRREKNIGDARKLYSQDAELSLVKIGGEWKIDTLSWK